MFKISMPENFIIERKWVLDFIFLREFNLPYHVEYTSSQQIEIGFKNKKIVLCDSFFSKHITNWLSDVYLPHNSFKVINASKLPGCDGLLHKNIPVLFGNDEVVVKKDDVFLGIDIFGSAFFMMSRYEEAVAKKKDQYDRTLAKDSTIYRAGFLDRPIINEYIEILWGTMKSLWPGLKRKKRDFRKVISCDVDVPYSPGIKSVRRLIRQICGDVIVRKNMVQGITSAINYFCTKTGNFRFDKYYSKFDWMMNLNEIAGNNLTFNFLADISNKKYDGCYQLNEPVVMDLMKKMSQRGHEIGLHPSFTSYRDKARVVREKQNLERIMSDLEISQSCMGSRQHLLRWSMEYTAVNLDYAGVNYDSTLTYPDHAGFRCGICYEYPMFDLYNRRVLKLIEKPLVAMDVSVFSSYYMGLSNEDGLKYLLELKDTCREYNGDFTLLWHNNQFETKQTMEIYKEIIQ